uniref:Cell division protein ZipA n=1 Tax=Candidatus Kentrum sp. TUN TaxID=2126343 RepID=A0A450ZV91_9GAMM|nr:MAG: cell division protein ZipA [Candidatus Kentron sp. TUN]
MDNLRLILFISGILVIAAIYAWEVFRSRRVSTHRQSEKPDIIDNTSPLQDHDVLNNPPASQNILKDKSDTDTDTDMPYWDQLDKAVDTVDKAGDKVVDKVALGDLNTLDNLDAERDFPATVPSDASPPLTEKADVTDTAVEQLETNVGERRSFVEKLRIKRNRPEITGFGKDHAGKALPEKELFIALTIMAKPGRQFMGSEIREQFEKVGMRLGYMQIFHHFGMADQQMEQSVFSAADILEPGVFHLDNIKMHSTKGLILFMQLPGPLDGLVAFELMLNVAQQLAKSLDGELCDDTRSTLTTQSANHLRERIEELKRRQLV